MANSDLFPNKQPLGARGLNGSEGTADYAVGALEGLVKKIASGRAIVYVGAGVSQSANLPSWSELLQKLQGEASNRLKNQGPIAEKFFENLKNRARNLELGDWLLRLLGPEFQQVISNSLSAGEDLCQIDPSTVHWNIVRSPFKMAITTNYDLILEKAYDDAYHACPAKLPYLTWKHTDEILRADAGSPFRIVHAHGTVGDNNSIVLSGSQYTLLHNARPRFEDVLKQFLKSYTFLFVGAGLEDPDLIYILQEAIAENAGVVGPHYALLPFNEAPQIRRDILRDSLHIEVIPIASEDLVKLWNKEASKRPPKERAVHWITRGASSILRALAGKVAHQRFKRDIPHSPTSDDPNFCLDISLVSLLRQSIEATGSFRGDICLSPDGIDSHLSGLLEYAYSEGATTGEIIRQSVQKDSICGIAYYQSDTRRGVYIRDVTSDDLAGGIQDSKLAHYGPVRYVSGDSRVRSEMALPIEADGVRVGVLNLESNLVDAYGEEPEEKQDYLQVAMRFAEKAGRLYAAAYDRETRSARLKGAGNAGTYKQMREFCRRLWHLSRPGCPGVLLPVTDEDPAAFLELLVYRARYRKGELESQDPKATVLENKNITESEGMGMKKVEIQRFPFSGLRKGDENHYLATRVYCTGQSIYYDSICNAIRAKKIRTGYCAELGLSLCEGAVGGVPADHICESAEPIIGFPVLIHGRPAGVVVAWHFRQKKNATLGPPIQELDSRDIELFRRAVHLMANYSSSNIETCEPENDGGIGLVKSVLDCFAGANLEGTTEYLDGLGQSYRNQIGSQALAFLILLQEQENNFRTKFKKQKPTDWIIPRRCRLWVRVQAAGDSEEGNLQNENHEDEKIRFVLAFELELKPKDDADNYAGKNQSWRNLFTTNLKNRKNETELVNENSETPEASANDMFGIIMEPLPRAIPGVKAPAHQSQRFAPALAEVPVDYWIPQNPVEVGEHKGDCLKKETQKSTRYQVYRNNPHMSFLLSRITVYPYAFQQMPRVIGEDIMAEALDKNPDLPWYVAPLIGNWKDQWLDPTISLPKAEQSQKKKPEMVPLGSQDMLVGYLTFDNGPGYDEWKKQKAEEAAQSQAGKSGDDGRSESERVDVEDNWANFQNDLLHQMTLFAACLAQQPCLRILAPMR